MAKEGIFSAIQFEVEQAAVLDLFAGSGQLGIEALSRGARAAVFVDSSRECQRVIRENLSAAGLASQARVAAMDYADFLRGCNDFFDIVLIDPPYGQGLAATAAQAAAAIVRDRGVIVCETEFGAPMPDAVGRFDQKKQYRYGKAAVTMYRRKGE
jgi:16S rRNA (guanine(966)-N(2))-methyltransferase RsmD